MLHREESFNEEISFAKCMHTDTQIQPAGLPLCVKQVSTTLPASIVQYRASGLKSLLAF